jgi:alanyl-tRNA synthetase
VLSKQIRRGFLDFFAGQNHTIVPSSSLVPEKDPSLLFVNAGMVQFKNVFLGQEKRAYSRGTSSQKCVRAGGKHNDLENVGRTLRHHTFFEMLGNFSFGDYFKKEAIGYAWEYLLKNLNLDLSRMWFTVFREDDEARELWKAVGAPPDRIVGLGEKDNFWSMGDEGPCGPCSEIIYDLGEHVGCQRPTCGLECDCDRFLEIWNLVFMQYERTRDGQMTKLPNPSIDTGMGLERICSVMQGKVSNYDTDLFVPLIRKLEEISGGVYGENGQSDIAFRVIADHVRGATFIINDGVLPSKDGRGYVLRRIMRRAIRFGKKLGIEKEFLGELSRVLVDMMDDVYPDVRNNYAYILKVLQGEEERFLETLTNGMRLYEEVRHGLAATGQKVIPGDVVYRLYDTFGFPVDITEDMAGEDNLVIDAEGFAKALEEQKERSRGDWKAKKEGWSREYTDAIPQGAKNIFTGYETLESEGTVLSAARDGAAVEALDAGEEGDLFFDVTPFYGEAGGQVCDEGIVESGDSQAVVVAVNRVRDDLWSHHVRVKTGSFRKGQKARLKVDLDRRKSIARNHTATHLLQFGLRMVLGDHVKQSGSLVDQDHLRFDFTHFQALTPEEIIAVEDTANEKILASIDVKTELKTKEEAIREGATALFEEKYGEAVRVVKVSDFSAELCGGTHVRNTGEIGSLAIISEGSLAYGVRRIEAVTGKAAIRYRRKLEGMVKGLAKDLNTELEKVPERVETLLSELDLREKELQRLREGTIRQQVEEAIGHAWEKDGARIVSIYVEGAQADDLRKVTDLIRNKVKGCVVVAGTKDDSKGIVVVSVAKELQDHFSAGKIVKTIAEKFGGKGGGNPAMAQGGVPADKVEDALRSLKEIL